MFFWLTRILGTWRILGKSRKDHHTPTPVLWFISISTFQCQSNSEEVPDVSDVTEGDNQEDSERCDLLGNSSSPAAKL